jgi:hypothetical protein
LSDFVRCVVLLPLNWPDHPVEPAETVSRQLLSQSGWAPGHFGLAVLGLIVAAYRLRLPRARRRGEPILALPALLHFLAIPFVPALYLQYYLLGLPILACQSTASAIMLWDARKARFGQKADRKPAWLPMIVCVTVFVVAPAVWLISLAGGRFADDLAPWLTSGRPALYSWLDKLSFSLFAVGALIALARRRVGLAVMWLAMLLPALGRDAVFHVFWHRAGQMRQLAVVHELVPRDEMVLDGYTGYGCLRPHAFYWWWINHHSIPLIERERALPALRETLATGKPALVIQDANLRSLEPVIGETLRTRYRPVAELADGTVLWQRR